MSGKIVAVMIKWLEKDAELYQTVAGGTWSEANHAFETLCVDVMDKQDGFMTSTGMFVDPYEAYEIARSANQLLENYWTPAPNTEKLEDYMLIRR